MSLSSNKLEYHLILANDLEYLSTIVRTVLAMELQVLQVNCSSDCIFNSKLAFELTLIK